MQQINGNNHGFFFFLSFYTVPFKFDTPSPDDVVSAGLKSTRNIPKGITCLQLLFLNI